MYTTNQHIHGPLSTQQLQDIHHDITLRFIRTTIEGETQNHSDTDDDDCGQCAVCDNIGTLIHCNKHIHCSGWHHIQCHPHTELTHLPHWSCPKCKVHTRHRQYHPTTLRHRAYPHPRPPTHSHSKRLLGTHPPLTIIDMGDCH